MTTGQLTAQFREKATLVSAVIHEVKTLEEAFGETISILRHKAPLLNLMAATDGRRTEGTSSPENGTPIGRIVAAPNLPDSEFAVFESLSGPETGVQLIRNGLRRYPGGIDMGFTRMDYGIADTGTLVLNSNSEETRLATMLSEIHVAVVATSAIRSTALSMTRELQALTSRPGSYTAFITGASRTADIERVLALGVHGPLELHIMLLEE